MKVEIEEDRRLIAERAKKVLDAKDTEDINILDFARAIKDDQVVQVICNHFVGLLRARSSVANKTHNKINTTELKKLLQTCHKAHFYQLKSGKITYKQFQARIMEQIQNKNGKINFQITTLDDL